MIAGAPNGFRRYPRMGIFILSLLRASFALNHIWRWRFTRIWS